jgi:hypothetical protein
MDPFVHIAVSLGAFLAVVAFGVKLLGFFDDTPRTLPPAE